MARSRESEEAAARLRTALEMSDLGAEMMRESLKRSHPGASKAEIDALMARWRQERPGAEDGDGEGVLVPWPRVR